MRVPGSYNSKATPPALAAIEALDPNLVYEVPQLASMLVAATLRKAFAEDGRRHELALHLGALLGRAEWDLAQALQCMNYLYDLSPGSDRRGKLDAIRTTYEKREAGEAVASRLIKEVLGDKAYEKLLLGLGITSRDGDLILHGEVIGTKAHIERDIANYLIASGDWASADGHLVQWDGTIWADLLPETLRARVFQTLSALKLVAKGEEVAYVSKASTAGAITSVVIGQLLAAPLTPANPLELPLTSGVLDIRTGELTSHRRNRWHRWTVDLLFDPAATCPTWLRFLQEAAPPDCLTFLQEWVGYCLMAGNDWQRMLWLYGKSGTGKSKFLSVVNYLLGPSAVAIGSEKLTEYTLASLAGMRVAMASELSPRTMRTSALKALVAGDAMQARHPYGRPFDLVFSGKVVWSSNAMPPLDQAEGMRRRINVVEFNNLPEHVDVFLEDKLRAELPGILNWALVGANRLLALRAAGSSDWQLPPSVSAFVDQYMESADPTIQFFQEEVELIPGEDVRAIEVYQRYVQWAKERQVYVEPWGPAFYRAMRAYGLEQGENQVVGKRLVRVWRGGRLVPGILNL
jgi:P4 family phage/plasmid primase-like protien